MNVPARQPTPDGEPKSLILDITPTQAPKSVTPELMAFGERLGMPAPRLAELVVAVEDLERKLLRHRSPQARITIRTAGGDAAIEWSVSNARITGEDSRAMYLGPLPTASNRNLAPPRDVPVMGAGW